MKTAEIVWKGKPLSELLTPWKAEAHYILQKMGLLWYGIEDDYIGFFFDPPLLQFHFVNTAAAYYVEHGGLRSEFYARIEEGKEFCKEVPEHFPPIMYDIFCPTFLGLGQEKFFLFENEPEIQQIKKFLSTYIRAFKYYLSICAISQADRKYPICTFAAREEAAKVPPLEYFKNLKTESDITIDELEKLIQQSQNLS